MKGDSPKEQLFLKGVLGVIAFTMGVVLLYPAAGQRNLTSPEFPEAVPLSKWEQKNSKVLKGKELLLIETDTDTEAEATFTQPIFIAGQKYLYEDNGNLLEVEMRYQISTWGDIRNYFKNHPTVSLSRDSSPLEVREQEGVGFYNLLTEETSGSKYSHLVACLNPNGESTATKGQFEANRLRYDLQPQRFFAWLLGQEALIDQRCLWVHLSIPLQEDSPELTYALLEDALVEWSQWWSSRFPSY